MDEDIIREADVLAAYIRQTHPLPHYRITILPKRYEYDVLDDWCWSHWGRAFFDTTVIERQGCLGYKHG